MTKWIPTKDGGCVRADKVIAFKIRTDDGVRIEIITANSDAYLLFDEYDFKTIDAAQEKITRLMDVVDMARGESE